MRSGSIYLVVRDFERSLNFYEKVLDMKVSAVNGTRFAMFFNEGLNICLMNAWYDEQHPEQKRTAGPVIPAYDDMGRIARAENPMKVFINLSVADLDAEHRRIEQLGIAEGMTPIRYLNVFSPYWYFTFTDPDGNPIEVAGGHQQDAADA